MVVINISTVELLYMYIIVVNLAIMNNLCGNFMDLLVAEFF